MYQTFKFDGLKIFFLKLTNETSASINFNL